MFEAPSEKKSLWIEFSRSIENIFNHFLSFWVVFTSCLRFQKNRILVEGNISESFLAKKFGNMRNFRKYGEPLLYWEPIKQELF